LAADGSVIVIPEIVIDELDAKKTTPGELGYQAREFGRLITKAKKKCLIVTNDISRHVYTYGSITIEIASSSNYPDYRDVNPKIINDRKIIEIATQYKSANIGKVTFITNDINCRIRAESINIETLEIREVDKVNFEFVKTLNVSADDMGSLHKKNIIDVDPDYTVENFNYKFYCQELDYLKLGYIHNGLINIIGKETETELRRQSIPPINAEQLFLSRAMQDPNIEIVICEALSGSGKTAVSVSNAMKLIGTNNPYTEILYIRASINDVDKAEEVGFLPGLETKFEPFLHPINDVLNFIARENNKNSKLKSKEFEEMINAYVEDLKERYKITAITTLGMRGRTFENCVAIIDEAQNMSRSSMQKVITRFGKNVKIIIIGSNRQIDNPYLTKYTNGLSTILEDCTKEDEKVRKFAINLHKVVRSPIAEWAERLFSSTNKEE
jgi:PhoH-like ATPase